MKLHIKNLERQAQKLEVPAEERRNLFEKAQRYGEGFLNSLPEKPAYVWDEEMSGAVSRFSFDEESKSLDRLLELLDSEVDNTGLNPTSGKHVGYIPGGGFIPRLLPITWQP